MLPACGSRHRYRRQDELRHRNGLSRKPIVSSQREATEVEVRRAVTGTALFETAHRFVARQQFDSLSKVSTRILDAPGMPEHLRGEE